MKITSRKIERKRSLPFQQNWCSPLSEATVDGLQNKATDSLEIANRQTKGLGDPDAGWF